MVIINALGQPCPIPVVKAKQAIAELPAEGGVVEVLIDNHVATENLRKMAEGSGYAYSCEERSPSKYAARIFVGTRQEAPLEEAPVETAAAGNVVAIGQDQMGHGSEELGRILIKGFIFALAQLNPPPQAVLFFNGGVKLTLDGANTLDDLKALEAKGCKIMVCGTCVDYYQVKEQVAVGEITNMMGIAEWMNRGVPVITL